MCIRDSLGAFLVAGLALRLAGFANDYVGKGMAGGLLVVRPPADLGGGPGQAVALVGNTVLYGATGGALFVAGTAGQRFAVRNSGARAVVEGVGGQLAIDSRPGRGTTVAVTVPLDVGAPAARGRATTAPAVVSKAP